MTDVTNGNPSHAFEHLSCFLPGLLALGAHTLGPALEPRVHDIHAWAAQGLAYTCWMTYADHVTGLGPDVMRMDPVLRNEQNPYGGLWLYQVEQWEEAGKPGGVPPGLREGSPMPEGKRDYRATRAAYLLRPEVRSFVVTPASGADAALDADRRELLPDVAHDRRRCLARAWLGRVPSDRARGEDEKRLCKRLECREVASDFKG